MMARRARSEILYDGCYAHVFSRSLDQKQVFPDRQSFEEFKRLLLEAKKKEHFFIHHYCLLNTHFHLAVSIPHLQGFSNALKFVKTSYTAYFNRKYRCEGPIWRERFKSLLIEDERYLYACGLYIEQNPLKAHMVQRSEEWPYSSSRHYVLEQIDPLIDGYELPSLPDGIDLDKNEFFTSGHIIGAFGDSPRGLSPYLP